MDYSKLHGYLPDSIYNQIAGILSFGIDGPKRLANLMGQCQEETGNFTKFSENLSYSGAALWSLFHTHFSSPEEANSFAHQPERIANRIYANRIGNGDEASGDGWKYRGRGALQTTGRANYKLLGDFLHIDLLTTPDIVATDYQLASAAFFFKNGNLWPICDKGIDIATITIITHHVNGGEINLSERIRYTQAIYHQLTA